MENDNKEEVKEEIKQNQETQQPKETTFTKQNILNSKKYAKQKDLVNALLKDDTTYTLKEVDDIINKYLKGVVE